MTLAFFFLIQYRSVTHGQTDGRTDIPPLAIPAVCIARYANALVKMDDSEWPFCVKFCFQASISCLCSPILFHLRTLIK